MDSVEGSTGEAGCCSHTLEVLHAMDIALTESQSLNPAQPAAAEPWSLARRIAFRFAFAYLIVYMFPSPLDQFPGLEWATEPYENLWKALVPWVGQHVLGLSQEIPTAQTGSGDKLFNYVQLVCYLALSGLATGVWSVVDRRRTEYAKLQAGLRIYVRYALAGMMLGYGMAKLFKTQFSFPTMDRLMKPYGESSPMGLLWTFMGYSTGYNIFTGGAEALGGLLLFFRRTTTLGSLVVVGVMSNVVMLNFCYDVPVKLLSMHLLLMAVFLLLPDLRRLANVLVLNRPTEPVPLRVPFQSVWMERGSRAAKALFIAALLFLMAKSEWEGLTEYGDNKVRPALYGIYDVESFTRNGEVVPPLTTDASRWRALLVDRFTWAIVHKMSGPGEALEMKDEPEKQTLTLTSFKPDSKPLVFTYSRPDPEHLVLDGKVGNDQLSIRFTRSDPSKFQLVNRGFHWINERPLNR
jgi:hypothetical protein